MIILREFQFDAAHWQPSEPDYRPNGRVHGHTFNVIVSFYGKTGETGMIVDYAVIDNCLSAIVEKLDHHILNDFLDAPTNESVAKWVYDEANKIKGLPKCVFVEVRRKIGGLLAAVMYP